MLSCGTWMRSGAATLKSGSKGSTTTVSSFPGGPDPGVYRGRDGVRGFSRTRRGLRPDQPVFDYVLELGDHVWRSRSFECGQGERSRGRSAMRVRFDLSRREGRPVRGPGEEAKAAGSRRPAGAGRLVLDVVHLRAGGLGLLLHDVGDRGAARARRAATSTALRPDLLAPPAAGRSRRRTRRRAAARPRARSPRDGSCTNV